MANLSTRIETRSGVLDLVSPMVAASGSFGHCDELFQVVNPAEIGAITIKSLAAFESLGNSAPRLGPTSHGMMNSVGLPGPHVSEWVKDSLPRLRKTSARVIMAIWGRTPDEYTQAASIIAPCTDDFVALEINLSCPNTESGNRLFAQNAQDTKNIVQRVRAEVGGKVILSTKLSANVTNVTEIADAAISGGTDMLTLFNTVMGLSVDPDTRKPILGKGAGGYSGPGIFPIVQRGVHEIHCAFPDTPIIGTGGVSSGRDAVTMMMCGASAVGVATATFADPRALVRITHELQEFCDTHSFGSVSDLVGTVEMSG